MCNLTKFLTFLLIVTKFHYIYNLGLEATNRKCQKWLIFLHWESIKEISAIQPVYHRLIQKYNNHVEETERNTWEYIYNFPSQSQKLALVFNIILVI
jgi:hypothetical protein